MVVEIIPADSDLLESQQVAMERADNGDEVAGSLNCAGVVGSFMDDLIFAVGDCGLGHALPPIKQVMIVLSE
jgi:hypothetical protein